MSPKRKKVEAALKNLFSNSSSPKPAQEQSNDVTEKASQQSVDLEKEVPAEKPAVKTPRIRRVSSAKKESTDIKTTAVVEQQQTDTPPVKQSTTKEPTAAVVKQIEKIPEGEEKPTAPPVDLPDLSSKSLPAEPVVSSPSVHQAPKEPENAEQQTPLEDPSKTTQPAGKERKYVEAETQLVVFQLDSEFYGVDIALVESIIKVQAYTIVPHTPEYIVGVTNLRGYVLPIVDLRTRFALPTAAETQDTRIMVLLINGEKVGMIVDEVNEVARVLNQDIEPTPPLIVNINMEFVDGIAKLRDENHEIMRMAILLNMEKVLKIK